jgi:mRNA-degrading endonuclease RelE of RelBE toxin-antitoxin system
MNHSAAPIFGAEYEKLPRDIRALAAAKYELLKQNPRHTSLRLKRIERRFWSVRVNGDYRALGVDAEDGILWFWIGPHDEYERVIRS